MSLTIFAKSSIVCVLLGSKYAYVKPIAPYRVRLTKWISEKNEFGSPASTPLQFIRFLVLNVQCFTGNCILVNKLDETKNEQIMIYA